MIDKDRCQHKYFLVNYPFTCKNHINGEIICANCGQTLKQILEGCQNKIADLQAQILLEKCPQCESLYDLQAQINKLKYNNNWVKREYLQPSRQQGKTQNIIDELTKQISDLEHENLGQADLIHQLQTKLTYLEAITKC